ncbi:MAG: TAXI family TRAP transporter solute-binding subunit [Thermodesulfobacteriota bacterium]
MKNMKIVVLLMLLVSFFLFSLAATPAAAKTRYISIGTGGTGGVYYPYGGGLAEIFTRYVEGVKAVAEVTGASVENVKLADKGETVIAEAMNDVVYQGYNGIGKFEGKPQKILAMFQMYPHHYHVVTLKGKDIKTIYDIKGKKVSVGAPGSGTEFKTNLVLQEALEIPYSSFKVFRLSFTENANALKDGTIDVGIWDVAAPTSSVMDLSMTRDIHIIPFSKEDIDKICEKFPFYSPFEMPAGIYKEQDKPIPNPSVWNTVACTASLDEDLVYNLVKQVFEHIDYLKNIHPFAKYTTPENAVTHSVIPLHPGAVKYYKEIGLTIPERLLPKK